MISLLVSGKSQEWDPVAARLRGAMITCCDSFERIPEAVQWDAAVIIDPLEADLERAARMLAAKKHVLLTANAAITAIRLDALAKAAQLGESHLAVVNPDRFLPSRKHIHQQLGAGKLGALGLLRSHRWEPLSEINDGQAPTFPAALLGDLELAVYYFDRLPNLVFGVEKQWFDQNQRTVQFNQVHLGFSDGGMALIDYSNGLPPGDSYSSLSLIGSTGAAYADDQKNMQLVYRGGHPESWRAEEKNSQIQVMIQEFVIGINDNRNFAPTVESWKSAWKIASAVQESLATKESAALYSSPSASAEIGQEKNTKT